jgi:O-antigen/teichoic acid export membrane protein
MSEKRDIFVNTAAQVIGRVFTLIFALISVKLITNSLGPVGTGEYNTINTYINFFIVIADLGLFSVTVREISRNPKKERKIISNVFVIRLITAFLTAIVAASIVFFTRYGQNVKIGTLIASTFIFFNLMSSVYDMILQTRLKMQFSALAEFISRFLALVALFVVIRYSGNFLWIISTIPLFSILIFLTKWLFAKRFLSFSPAFDQKFSGWIFALAWPMGVVFIVDNLYFKIDTLLLFIIKGAAEVGIYTVAYKILEVTVFAGSYFASSLKPAISRSIINNKPYLSNIISKSFLVMIILALPITIISAAFPKEIVIFLSNTEFTAGSKALVFLGFTLPIIYLDILLGEILVANDERKLLIKIAIFILSFNFILNLILIPRYSFMGAAFVTFLSELVLFGINLHYTKRIVPYRIDLIKILQILLAGAITLILSLLLKNLSINFIILMIFSMVIYGLLFHLLKIVQIKSLKELLKGDL